MKTSDIDDSSGDDFRRRYVILAVRGAYRHRACRRAVLGSLLEPFLTKRKNLQAAFDGLREQWYARLFGLRDAGWHPLRDDPVNMVYQRNCPPFSVITSTTSATCRRPLVCPFCYARMHVLRPFCKLEKILYGSDSHYLGEDGKLLPVLRPDLKIVAFRCRTAGTRRLQVPLVTADEVAAHWGVTAAFISRSRKVEVTGFGAEYASVKFSVFPAKGERHLEVVRTGVALVPGGLPPCELKAYADGGGKVRQYEPLKRNLATACAYAFRYPRRMMTSSPLVAARLMEAMRQSRVSTWYGPRESKTVIGDSEDGQE